jgi:hypothetical protein
VAYKKLCQDSPHPILMTLGMENSHSRIEEEEEEV